MRSAAAAMLLNFLFLPMGYFYLKDSSRFIIGTFFAVLSIPIFSLLTWLFALFLPVWIIAPLALVLSFGLVILIAVDSYRLSRQAAPAEAWRIFSKPHAFWFIPSFIIFLGTAGILLEPWEKPFAAAHNIPSPSMEPNVQLGDLVFVDYMADTGNLKGSDIVIHEGLRANEGKKLIKRIIGLPGEHIRLFNALIPGPDKIPYNVTRYAINGKVVPLAFHGGSEKKYKMVQSGILPGNALFVETRGQTSYDILEEQSESYYPEDQPKEFQLGPDEFFLMGDNRDHAADSRYEGTMRRSQIIGKYMHTYFSFFIPNPTCEMSPTLVFMWRALTDGKNKPCSSVQIRWEKAGYVAH